MKAMIQAENRAERFFQIFDNPKNHELLQKLSLEELSQLNKMVVEVIKEKRNDTGKDIKKILTVGDIVEVDDKKFEGEIFEVLKLNPKKAQLQRENGEVWNVTYTAIKVA